MSDFAKTLEEVAIVLKAGNVVLPLRFYVETMRSASTGQKVCIYDEMRQIIEAYGKTLTNRELAAVSALFNSFRDQGDFEPQRQNLLARLETMQAASVVPTIGVAHVLLVSTVPFRGEPFGTVQALGVQTCGWGGDIRLTHQKESVIEDKNATSHSARLGFRNGVTAALRYVGKRIGTFDMESYLNNQTIEGSLLKLDCPVEGDSLALAAAAATVSLLLEIPVPAEIGFTGSVTEGGVVEQVGGVKPKIVAAKDFGLRKVYLPEGTEFDGAEDLEITYLSRIDQLIGTLFTAQGVGRGLAKLREVRVPPELRRRTWVTEQLVSGSPLRVLLTCIGGRDPFGIIARRNEPVVAHEDGPLLTIAREIHPEKIYLFYTTSEKYDKSNNFTERVESVIEMLRKSNPDCQSVPVPLPSVHDPTDLEQLFPAFQEQVEKIDRENTPPVQFFVNTSSGTPQIYLAWNMAVERGLIRNGIRLQAREGRFVEKDHESRVRRMDPPGW